MWRIAIGSFALLGLVSCNGDDSLGPSPSQRTEPLRPVIDLPLPIPVTTDLSVTEEDLHTRISILADDAFDGRAPGAEVGEKTADWIAAEFERIGLEPGGPDRSWFQTVEMVEQTLDPAASKVDVLNKATGEVSPLEIGSDIVVWTKHQTKTETGFALSDLIFVGYGIVAPEYGWNDYEGLDVSGKTVVMLVNDPGFARRDALFRGEAMTYYGRWTYKFEEATRQGATGAIIVHETEPASYGWNVVQNSWSGAQADLVRADDGASRPVLEAWITRSVADNLFAEAGLDFETLKRAATEPSFRPVTLGPLAVSAKLVQSVTRKQSRNIVGLALGTEAPEETVLVTSHWDHLGKKPDERTGGHTEDFYRDEIYNGAIDNATGTAALIEIAEAIARTPKRRTVMFLSVTLEESGLLGSAYYAEHPTVPLHQIVAGLNIDGLIPMGPTHDMVVIGHGASELEDILAAELSRQERIIKPDSNPQAGSFYRSDHISFAKKGVPMLYADNGFDKRDGGVAAGLALASAYRTQAYHKPMDEYDPTWDLSGMQEDVAVFLTVTETIAESTEWPTWYPGTEFYNVRRASLAKGQD